MHTITSTNDTADVDLSTKDHITNNALGGCNKKLIFMVKVNYM